VTVSHKLIFSIVCSILTGTLTTNKAVEAQPASSRINLESIHRAEKIGVSDDYEQMNNAADSDSDRLTKLNLEAQALRHLWLAQFQLNRCRTELREEQSLTSEAIEKIQTGKARLVGLTNTVNFLSNSIIAMVGNIIFIPAPPPKPTPPNILFTISSGVSTILSLVAYAEIPGGKGRIATTRGSMLEPIMTGQDPEGLYSKSVWTYLNFHPNGAQSLREILVAKWLAVGLVTQKELSNAQKLESRYGQSSINRKIAISLLRARSRMLDDLEVDLVQVNNELATLAREL
jgi:hypothetical protein